ncbi:MAG: hypothetical protein ACRCXX_13995 [Cetobacterium sp.]|uniref:hypothetical protein n=1 Tax=Cetobacterium sp. TaxID=2071632 RepID=UPI003F38E9E1
MLVKDIDREKFKLARKIMRENTDSINIKNGSLSQRQINDLISHLNMFLSFFEQKEDKELTVPTIIEAYMKILDEVIDVNQRKI